MTSTHDLFDLSYLEDMSGGDKDMRDTLLEMLVQELPNEQGKLLEAGGRGDTEAIFQASHSLKSTLAYTGNTDAIRLNQQIENSSREGRWELQDQLALGELIEKINLLIEGLTHLHG